MARVTSEDFAERLLRSAQQAVAIKRGEAKPARVTRRKVTARKVVVEEAPRYAPARIIELREGLGVSQPVFAGMVGVRPVTVKAWEQGQKEPNGSARRLLQVLESRPGAVIAAAGIKDLGVGGTPRTGKRKGPTSKAGTVAKARTARKNAA